MTTVLIRRADLVHPEEPSSAWRAAPVRTVKPPRIRPEEPIDIVDQWGMQSFPASDPPANW